MFDSSISVKRYEQLFSSLLLIAITRLLSILTDQSRNIYRLCPILMLVRSLTNDSMDKRRTTFMPIQEQVTRNNYENDLIKSIERERRLLAVQVISSFPYLLSPSIFVLLAESSTRTGGDTTSQRVESIFSCEYSFNHSNPRNVTNAAASTSSTSNAFPHPSIANQTITHCNYSSC